MNLIDSPSRPSPLRRMALSVGLLLVEWSHATPTAASARASTEAVRSAAQSSAPRSTPVDHDSLIRRHHTQLALEQERSRAEARTLMVPLSW